VSCTLVLGSGTLLTLFLRTSRLCHLYRCCDHNRKDRCYILSGHLVTCLSCCAAVVVEVLFCLYRLWNSWCNVGSATLCAPSKALNRWIVFEQLKSFGVRWGAGRANSPTHPAAAHSIMPRWTTPAHSLFSAVAGCRPRSVVASARHYCLPRGRLPPPPYKSTGYGGKRSAAEAK